MRRLQLLLGIVLAVGAAVGVFFFGQLNQPPVFDVVIAIAEVPAFSEIDPGSVSVDRQSVSSAVAQRYVLVDEWASMLAEGKIAAAEPLHPGQPLMREQVVSGAEAEGLSRLSVVLDDPNQVIISVPVDQNQLPSLVPGDVIALYFTADDVYVGGYFTEAGGVSANVLVTETVEGELPTPTPSRVTTGTRRYGEEPEIVTTTIELEMPLAKQIVNGVVYRFNQERKANPNYGAPGMENEPRYILGAIKALDVVIPRESAEWVVFALAHGRVRIGVLPIIARPLVEGDTFPPSVGVTWTDFEERFFEEREAGR